MPAPGRLRGPRRKGGRPPPHCSSGGEPCMDPSRGAGAPVQVERVSGAGGRVLPRPPRHSRARDPGEPRAGTGRQRWLPFWLMPAPSSPACLNLSRSLYDGVTEARGGYVPSPTLHGGTACSEPTRSTPEGCPRRHLASDMSLKIRPFCRHGPCASPRTPSPPTAVSRPFSDLWPVISLPG